MVSTFLRPPPKVGASLAFLEDDADEDDGDRDGNDDGDDDEVTRTMIMMKKTT